MSIQVKNLYLVMLLWLIAVSGCDISENEIRPEDNFFRVYDSFDFGASFIPLDVIATPDSGYLILGSRRLTESNFVGTYIMKVNAQGLFEAETRMDPVWVQPANSLLMVEDKIYFFCMNATSLRAHIVPVNADGTIEDPIQLTQEIYYPMSASVSGDQLLLLSYDNLTKNSVLSLVNTNGNVPLRRNFSIGPGDGVEGPIIRHFTRTGKRLPFFTGTTSTGVPYFNGFFNYTMSLVFVNFNNETPVGVVQGQQENGGLSGLISLNGGTFAAARYNFGDNYLIPNANLTTTGTTSSTDLQGNPVPELVEDSPIAIKQVEIDGINFIFYAGNTRNGQILLLAFDENSGTLSGSKYLGFSNQFEVSSMKPLSDGGLVVLGTTYAAGRFARTCLVKLSKGDLEDIIRVKP